MEIGLPTQIQEHIYAELYNEEVYRQMAEMAPTDEHRKLLLEFARDDRSHADELTKIYRSLFVEDYSPVLPPIKLSGTYQENLRKRVLEESESFRTYDRQYRSTNNTALKNAYYRARADDNVHTSRLLYLLND